VSGKEIIIDPASCNFEQPVADLAEIRRFNRQRFEMEQLTAIVHVDPENHIFAGYKDIGPDEFWVRGHMPGMPLMPGVLMLEAAAQLCSWYATKYNLSAGKIVGFGGLEEVHFRGPVVPGDRLFIGCKGIKIRIGRMVIFQFQGLVRDTLVVDGILKGIPLPNTVGM
jgi:3-hydroxyacyl-[acyl-carrier-protein] dehydratase